MAIQVNVISENATFNVETANYCTVALPITSCWGPGFTLPSSFTIPVMPNRADFDTDEAYQAAMETYTEEMQASAEVAANAFENTAWSLFPASPEGFSSFVATYRGPASNYRSTKDYSYFTALSLLNAGYAVQTCRLCPGTTASVVIGTDSSSSSNSGSSASGSLVVTAKYPGTFGNSLKVVLTQKSAGSMVYWNLVGYTTDASGITTAIENLLFVFNPADATDNIVALEDLQSKFFVFDIDGVIDDETARHMGTKSITYPLTGGSDVAAVPAAPEPGDEDQRTVPQKLMDDAIKLAELRGYENQSDYHEALESVRDTVNQSTAESIRFMEWVYTYSAGNKAFVNTELNDGVQGVYDLLKDKINYNPNRVICPWDDQDLLAINPDWPVKDMSISVMHKKLMEVAADSRCATAYIDVPRSLPRNRVWDDKVESDDDTPYGYAQKLSHDDPTLNDGLYASNSALFAPWGQYTYAGTTRQAPATPSFLALIIDRSMIKNQPVQYEWALPTTRRNNVKIGQLAYKIPKSLLDKWQAPDGTRVNTIAAVPSLGTTIWGNATLFDVPVATYQALMNLSTRKLINAVKDVVFKIGIGLEFQYNGQEAYAKFYAGVTPLLDTMRNVGAIEDYKVTMAADINNIDSINANSVVGTIYLVIAGVIENITVDLIALPQGTDLNQY